jgi:hypothetical protein
MEKSDYRPIYILPVLAKAFESVMYELMVNYISRNGLISSFQSGFKPGHRTATDIARVSDDIRLNMESNQPTIGVCHGCVHGCHGCHGCDQRHTSLLIFLLGIKKVHVGTMFLL